MDGAAVRNRSDIGSIAHHLVRSSTTWSAKAVASALFLLPIAYVEPVLLPTWSPRMIVALLVVPMGIGHLVQGVRRRDPATWWLVGLMAACALSTLIAKVPLWNLRGGYGRDSSLTFLLVLASFWAAGRALDEEGRRLAVAASISGVAVSCLAAVVQTIIAPSTGIFALIGDRPGGLLDNPVALGAVAAGAAVLTTAAWARGRVPDPLGAGATALFTASVSLSGSRGAVAALLVGLVASVVASAGRTRWAIPASAATGWLSALVLADESGGRDVADRTSLQDGGRSDVWRYALEAFSERPILGHGLGQFRSAAQPYYEPEFVEKYATHPLRGGWPDAHNVLLQYAVVGGLLAVILICLFSWTSLSDARGPLKWAALAVAFTWMLQPITLATGPIGMAWLGLAMSPFGSDTVGERRDRLAVLLGVVLAIGFLTVDQQLHRNVNEPAAFSNQARLLPADPLLASRAADLNSAVGNTDEAIRWARRRSEMEPFSAPAAASLAELLVNAGRTAEAQAEILRALERDPYNPTALRVAFGIALVTDDEALREIASIRLDALADAGDEREG